MTVGLERLFGDFDAFVADKNRTARAVAPTDGDYLQDGILMCGKCHTARQYDYTIPADRWGKEQVVRLDKRCGCRTAVWERENRARDEARNGTKIDWLRADGLPRSYASFTFANDDGRNSKITKWCKRYVDMWLTAKERQYGMMFCGGVGTGKTFHAATIANGLIDKGVKVKMLSTAQFINMPKDENRDFLRSLNYSLYILDDLGAERSSEYAIEQLKLLVDGIEQAQKPLIVTTNIPPDMIDREAENGNRVYDRINKMCAVKIPITGGSRRKTQAKQIEEEMLGIFGGDHDNRATEVG